MYTPLFTEFYGNLQGLLRGECIHLTDKSKVLTVRVPNEVAEQLEGVNKREILESLVKLRADGRIEVENNQIVVPEGVYTENESVYTNDCDGCPYMENALDMSKFDEVCEFKGLDRQKALDRCVQMLWR